MANIKKYFVFFTDLVTIAKDGIMSAADKRKLDGIAENANNYSHPNSGVQAGIYKSVKVNAQGHVTEGSNPTTLAGYGITDAASGNHSHSEATQSVKGFLSASDKKKLDGISESANNYSHPNSGVQVGIYKSVKVNAQGHVTEGSNPTTLAGYGITDAASKNHTHTIDSTLSKTSENPVQNKVIATEIESLKKSGSESKKVVADALTEMGVSTATDASFDTIAANIKKIFTGTDTSDANALASQILKNQTAYVKGEKIVGTMENRGSLNWSGNNTTYAVPAGYYSGGTLDSRGSYQSGYNSGYTAGQNAAKLKYTDGTVFSWSGSTGVITVPATEINCGFQPDIIILFFADLNADGRPFLSINYPYQTGYIVASQYTIGSSYYYKLYADYSGASLPTGHNIITVYPSNLADIEAMIDNYKRTSSGFSIGPLDRTSYYNEYCALKYKAIKFT